MNPHAFILANLIVIMVNLLGNIATHLGAFDGLSDRGFMATLVGVDVAVWLAAYTVLTT